MKKIRFVYLYIYYTLYKAAQNSPTIFPYSFITILSFDAILLMFLSSCMFYYTGLTSIIVHISDILFLVIISILVFAPNFFIFDYKNKYKKYVNEFDEIPKNINYKYKIIAWIGIILIILNFIYSLFYADQQARKNHLGRYAPEYIEYEKQQIKEDSISRANRSY